MARSEPRTVLTIGHSSHSYEHFLELLRKAQVTAVADVRTAPYSRHYPHFNGNDLKRELRQDGISYLFLGNELGGRPTVRQFYCDGIADYEKMAATEEFRTGLDRVAEGAKKYRIVLMCSEQDPLDCHRCLLVGRALAKHGITVKHVMPDGRILEQAQIEDRLLKMSGRENDDMFAPREERLAAAYRERARKVAFVEPKFDPKGLASVE